MSLHTATTSLHPSLDDLLSYLPPTPLFQATTDANSTTTTAIGWQLSPDPYSLSPERTEFLNTLGEHLASFYEAIQALYKLSQTDTTLSWVKHLFEQGKPSNLVSFSLMKRFKSHFPLVIRPDLLVTDNGFALCEMDSVPGGIGFTAALAQAYHQVGYHPLTPQHTIPTAFLTMLQEHYQNTTTEPKPTPFIAIVVSDEANDYRLEMQWLASIVQTNYPHIAVIHPKQIVLDRNQLGFLSEDGQTIQPIDIIYRFFELFDLPNIPNIELIQYAVKKGLVVCTPPFKSYLEEKFVLALFHHPTLSTFWEKHLSNETRDILHHIIPESWLLDPAPVPPHAAVLPPLQLNQRRFQDFTQLNTLTQQERRLVIKPSGFSPLAWGSRGVIVGHDVSQELWQEQLQLALSQYRDLPHLMQRYESPTIEPYRYFDPTQGSIIESEGRTRLCPYYFFVQNKPTLVGVLATTCPKNKKVIHGMRDGVMRPALPKEVI